MSYQIPQPRLLYSESSIRSNYQIRQHCCVSTFFEGNFLGFDKPIRIRQHEKKHQQQSAFITTGLINILKIFGWGSIPLSRWITIIYYSVSVAEFLILSCMHIITKYTCLTTLGTLQCMTTLGALGMYDHSRRSCH